MSARAFQHGDRGQRSALAPPAPEALAGDSTSSEAVASDSGAPNRAPSGGAGAEPPSPSPIPDTMAQALQLGLVDILREYDTDDDEERECLGADISDIEEMPTQTEILRDQAISLRKIARLLELQRASTFNALARSVDLVSQLLKGGGS